MRKMMVFMLVFLKADLVIAQLTPSQRIQDSVIGWYRVLPKKATTPISKNGRTFTVAQQEKLNEIVRWMYKSYMPVAGIGTYDKNFATDLGAVKHYYPHAYGIEFRVWNVSFEKNWLDAKGNFKPVDEEYESFYVYANSIPATTPVSWLNTDDRYIFTWEADMPGSDKLIHPNVSPYFIWQNKNIQTIFLVPGNKISVIPVTKGELLTMAEESVDRYLAEKKLSLDEQFRGNPKGAATAYESWKKNVDQYRLSFKKLKAKHQSTLDEPAVINDDNLSISGFDNDPFIITENQRNYRQYYSLYQYTSGLLQKCKSDQPQWLTITVPFKTRKDGNQEYEMYQSVIENFNYEYAYNYFFNPGKIQGKPYTPASEEKLTARLNEYRNKGIERSGISNNGTSPGILFADDFSANTEGSNPKGWYMNSGGEHSFITAIENETGKWLKLGYNNPVSPITLKKPLPQNISVNFDVATDEFSSRTGGSITLYMSTYPLLASGKENKSKDGAWIKLIIRAGNENDLYNNNYSGEVKLELHSNPPLFRENFNEGAFYTKSLKEFTNQKRKLQVKLSFNNGEMKLFLNNKMVAVSDSDMKLAYGSKCADCRIPAGQSFNTIHWENSTNTAKETGVYISNIQITKE